MWLLVSFAERRDLTFDVDPAVHHEESPLLSRPFARSLERQGSRDQSHRARLRTFLADFIDEAHGRTDLEPVECPVKNAVAMEVDLAPIGRFDEAIALVAPQFRHATLAVRLLSRLHVTALTSHMILEPTAQAIESLVDSSIGILACCIGFWSMAHHDLTTRNGQIDAHSEMPAALLVPVGALDHDVAAGDAGGEGLELFRPLLDVPLDGIGVWDVTEGDLNGKRHGQMACSSHAHDRSPLGPKRI